MCLVTSRNGKRWVIPKGCLEAGKTASEIAAQEAWEEAGLEGSLEEDPLGHYFYEKAGNRYRVSVYLMHVMQVRNDWPERYFRARRWVAPTRALSHVEEFGLRKLIHQISRRRRAELTG
jgi:8-oxo-dGTP pyrophosphatase MutT (NUDIX family)